MKSRLLLVAASVLAVAGLLFFLLREQPTAPADADAAAPPGATTAAPHAAAPHGDPARAPAADGTAADADPNRPRESVSGAPTWDLHGIVRTRAAGPLEGARVLIHRGSANDARGFMEAALGAAALDPNLPGARELRRPAFVVEGEPLATVDVAPDGSFDCPALAERHVRLLLEHDLYALTQPELVDLARMAGRSVVLQPFLGACVRGQLLGLDAPAGKRVRLQLDLDPMAPVRDPRTFVATMLRGFGEPAVAGADGRFRFRAVPPTPGARLQLVDDELCGSAGPFALVAGETREVPLRVAPGGALRLRVVTNEDRPVAGASVRLRAADATPGLVMDRGWHSQTDAAGACRLGAFGAGAYRLVVEASGFVAHEEQLTLEPTATEHLVRLDQGGSVSGVVVDPEGQPIAEAGVAAVATLQIPVLGDLGGLVGDDLLALEARQAKCRTDAEGRFTLRGIGGEQAFAVAAAHTDFIAGLLKDVHAGDTGLRITLRPGARVRGRVIDGATEQPITDFEAATIVTMALVWERPTRIQPIHGSSDGTFELRNVAPGSCTLRVRADGYAEQELELTVEAGASVDAGLVKLVRGAVVHGIVVDPDDQPVADATVRVARGGIHDNPLFGVFAGARHVTTDAQGRFELDGLPGGRTTLLADAPGFAGGRRTRLDVPPGGTLRDVRIQLTAGGTIDGKLLLAPGARAHDWSISAGTLLGDAAGSAPVAADGTFRIEHLPAGTYRVQAFDTSSYGALAKQSEQSMRPGRGADFGKMITDLMQNLIQTTCSVRDGETTEVELDASTQEGSGASLAVEVMLGGRPLPDGWVECTAQSSGRTSLALLERGRAELHGLEAGAHRLQVRRGWMMAPVGAPLSVDVEAEAELQPVRLQLAGGSIAGRVLDARSGQPVSGAAVRLRAAGALERPSDFGFALTGADGGFEFAGLAEGMYSLCADESFSPRGEVAGRIDGIELGAGEERRGLLLHAERRAAIEAIVTDPSLAPVAQALVIAVDEHGSPVGTFAFGFTDADGRASFSALPPGRTRIAVRADGYAPAVSAMQEILRGQDHEFRVELVAGVPVQLRVETARGQLVRGARVACRIANGPWLPSLLLQRATSGDEVDLGRLPPGPVRLRIESPGHAPHEVERVLRGGARTTWTVTLPER